MSRPPSAAPAPVPSIRKPLLTCRVAVSGHRPKGLRACGANFDALQNQAAIALKEIANAVERVRDNDSRPSPYANGPPRLRLISPLAEGSDRIVARAALNLQEACYELQCVFPFAREAYARDFTERSEWTEHGSLEEFNELSSRASAILELDSDPSADNAYVAVGLTLVRQCDVLLAIWDGGKARGPGGTAEIILEALRANIPVIGIDARGTSGHALSLLELRHGRIAWLGWSANALADRLRTVFVLAPRRLDEHDDNIAPLGEIDLAHALFAEPATPPSGVTLYARVTRWAARLTADDEFHHLLTPELHRFAYEPPNPSLLAVADLSAGGLLSEEVRRDVAPEHRTSALRDLVARLDAALGAAYTWTDLQASRYAALHRSHNARSTLLLIPLAIVVGFVVQRCLNPGFIGTSWPATLWRVALSLVELGVLIAIFSSYITVREQRYHDRWLDYRSIAEKMRHIIMLTPLGRPGIDAELPPTLSANDARTHWTNWYVRAVAREVGVFPGKLHDAGYREACHTLLRHWLVRGQIRYHYFAAIKAHAPLHLLHKYRYLIFAFVVLSAGLDLVLEPMHSRNEHLAQLLECFLELVFFCGPAVFASFYAFTRLADFENIELRSRAELQRLTSVERELSERSDRSSVDLVRVTAMTSHSMLAELVEWRIAAAQRQPELGG